MSPLPDIQSARQDAIPARQGTGVQARPAPRPIRSAPSRPARHGLLASLDWRELAAVFVGGALGALARVWLGRTFAAASAGSWPWATFSINVSGSFLLGFFATRLQDRLPRSTYRRPFLGTGFCGAYTTFSTMQVEILRMIDHHHDRLALAYGLTSIASGYLAVWLATALVRRVRRLA